MFQHGKEKIYTTAQSKLKTKAKFVSSNNLQKLIPALQKGRKHTTVHPQAAHLLPYVVEASKSFPSFAMARVCSLPILCVELPALTHH